MIELRYGMFETNSSSSHTFMVPKEDIATHYPKVVDLDKYYEKDTPEYRIVTLYNSFGYDSREEKLFIAWLTKKGITVINGNDEDDYPASNTFKSEAQLTKFLFGEGVIEIKGQDRGEYNFYEKFIENKDKYDRVDLDW